MATLPNALLDLDQIAPPLPPTALPTELRRFNLAVDSAFSARASQSNVIRLVNGVEAAKLRQIGDNMRMRLLTGLRPSEPGAPAGDDALNARMRLYGSLELDPAFLDQSRQLGHRIARRFFDGLGSADLRQEWAARDSDGRLDIVADFLRAYYEESGHFPPGRIESDRVAPDAQGRIQTGEFRPDSDTLWLNEHPDAGWDDPVEVLTIAGHESTHKIQQDMGLVVVAEQRPDLVPPKTIGKLTLSGPEERVAGWYFYDNVFFGHISADRQPIGYRNQPIEVHARLVEDAVRQTLNRHLELGNDGGGLLSVSMDDLAELGLSMEDIRADGGAKPASSRTPAPTPPKRGLH